MPLDLGLIRDSMMPGLLEARGTYLDLPSVWERIFADSGVSRTTYLAVTRRALVDNLYSVNPTSSPAIEVTTFNNGEDDGLIFPREWKGT